MGLDISQWKNHINRSRIQLSNYGNVFTVENSIFTTGQTIRILVRISWVWRRDKDETKIQKIFLSSKNLPRSGCFRLLGTLSDIMRHLIDLHLSNPSTFIVFLKFEKSIFYVLFNFWVIFIFVNFSKTCRLSSNVSNLFSL